MAGEKYRPFVVTVLVGCALWVASGGFIHAYIISPDWGHLGSMAIPLLTGIRPFFALVFAGMLFGFVIEIAKFLGSVARSQRAAVLGPIAAGAAIGGLQGSLVSTELWGFNDYVVFRSAITRILSGASCGIILTPPTIFASIMLRRQSSPW